MIRFRCWNCGQRIRSRPDYAGRLARCPTCSYLDRVPSASPSAPQAANRPSGGKLDEERESILADQVPPLPDEPEQESLFESPDTLLPQAGTPVRYRCPHCQLPLRAPESAAGRSALCPRCRQPSPVPRPSAALPPSVPSWYEIVEELGRGDFGAKYRARNVQSDRVVALALLRDDVAPEWRPRLRQAAEAVAGLHHPNLVKVFEVGEHQGRLYCAFEFVEGGTLKEMLRGQPLPPRQAAQLTRDLASGIDHAHQHGVVHRSLDPTNVLFARKRSARTPDQTDPSVALMAGTLKVTNFGLPRRLTADDQASAGPAGYASPEQAAGREAGPAADVWALGAIFYEMLTGGPPFVGPTAAQTLDAVRRREPAAPRRLRPDVPAALEAVCLKCLEKSPSGRYATAKDLADDLGRFLAGEPVKARRGNPVARAVRSALRRLWG